ncbi:hypothetical protein HanXRQr2_Chr16g0768121 [Helianthus annuus]|uniref:Uncharacterized protein n=1 Tax=Helianthus annuus TaxID=4232 RepID=A0A251S2S8_HELAN|nr:hypothetical protein HanXRQr2_Chr16g0768121 [Helianthus annuus]
MILIIYTAPLHGAELHSFGTLIHPVCSDFCHQTRNRVNRSFIVQELPNIVVGCLCVWFHLYDYCFHLCC